MPYYFVSVSLYSAGWIVKYTFLAGIPYQAPPRYESPDDVEDSDSTTATESNVQSVYQPSDTDSDTDTDTDTKVDVVPITDEDSLEKVFVTFFSFNKRNSDDCCTRFFTEKALMVEFGLIILVASN